MIFGSHLQLLDKVAKLIWCPHRPYEIKGRGTIVQLKGQDIEEHHPDLCTWRSSWYWPSHMLHLSGSTAIQRGCGATHSAGKNSQQMNLPSWKLTARTWNTTVERRVFYFGKAVASAMLVFAVDEILARSRIIRIQLFRFAPHTFGDPVFIHLGDHDFWGYQRQNHGVVGCQCLLWATRKFRSCQPDLPKKTRWLKRRWWVSLEDICGSYW